MMIILVPFLCAVLGLVLYFVASNAKVTEVGRTMFWCGLLVTLFLVGGRTIRIG